MASVAAGYVDVEGGKIYYEVAGTGHPFVLIHAGVADMHMWDEQFEVFAERYRVIRYDTREFGQTTSEDVEYSNRQDLADLLKHLGVERTYIMGSSRGGQIATDFTLEHPDKVDALIAVAGGLSGFDMPVTEAETAAFAEMEAAEKDEDYQWLVDLEMQFWIDGLGQSSKRVDPQMRAKVRDMIAFNYAMHLGENCTALPLDPPAVGRLGEIHVPTLAIIADLDESATIGAMEYLAQNVAGAQKVVIHGSAHLPNMEQPAQFNQIVLEFLAKV